MRSTSRALCADSSGVSSGSSVAAVVMRRARILLRLAAEREVSSSLAMSEAATLPSLAGRCVLVTGGARRIGAVIARRLHAAGANVGLHYRQSAAEADALVAELTQARPGSAAAFG